MRVCCTPEQSSGIRSRLVLGALSAAALLWATSASAEYRLQPSDVLELSVVGIKDLQFKAPVDLDGDVVFPLAGRLKAAGKTVAEVQAEFGKRVESTPITQQTDEGQKSYFVDPSQVTIIIAEYRPVYVRGDVSKPGELPFRPGMTVRQAVASAGGYDLLRFSVDNPFIQSATLRAQYDSLWVEYAATQARVARLEAELAGLTSFSSSGSSDLPVDPGLLSDIVKAEGQQLTLRTTDLNSEKDHLQRLIDQNQGRLSILNDEQAKVKEDRDADEQDFQRIKGLFDKGILTADRAATARQALLTSSIRYLETTVDLDATATDLEKNKRDLEKADNDHRLSVLQDLQQARVDLAQVRAKINGVSENLVYLGNERSSLTQGLAGAPKLMVYSGGTDTQGRPANEGDILQPGDVVDVALVPTFPGQTGGKVSSALTSP